VGIGIAAGQDFKPNGWVYLFFGAAAVLALLALGVDEWWRQYRDRRRASLPTDEELGWFDHGERIEPLWRQRGGGSISVFMLILSGWINR
jgi:hypothetical protein